MGLLITHQEQLQVLGGMIYTFLLRRLRLSYSSLWRRSVSSDWLGSSICLHSIWATVAPRPPSLALDKKRGFESLSDTLQPHSISFGGALPARTVAVHTAHLGLLYLWHFVMLWHTMFRVPHWPSRHFLFCRDENICEDRTFILCAGWKLELLQQKMPDRNPTNGDSDPTTHPRI